MKPYVSVLSIVLGGLLIAGCASAPSAPPPAKPVAKPAAPPPPPAPKPVAALAQPPPPPPAPAEVAVPLPNPEKNPAATPEALAVVEKLTQSGSGAMPHTLAGDTGFPEAMVSLRPGAAAPVVNGAVDSRVPTRGLTADGSTTDLVEKDWTGIVLVPLDKMFSKLHNARIRILSIEAHPLADGRIRVWVRLLNKANEPVPAEVGCNFRLRGAPEPGGARFYPLPLDPGGTRDVFFVSPQGDLLEYTVLVRTADMAQ